MSILQVLYPGDRALEFFLIVTLGVVFLSTAAWVVAWRLPKKPAARHLVLVSALFGCLAMPLMATAFSASGVTLISIPLLPAKSHETDSSMARGTLMPVPAPGYLAAQSPPDTDQWHSMYRSICFNPMIGYPEMTLERPPQRSRQTCARGLHTMRQQRSHQPAGRSAHYRANATLALLRMGLRECRLLLRFARSWLVVHRLRGSSSPVRDASLLRLMDDVGRALGNSPAPASLRVADACRRRWRSDCDGRSSSSRTD